MKLSHCHVNVKAVAVGVDVGPCQMSMMKSLAKKIHHRCLKGVQIRLCTVRNEKLKIDKQIACIMSGANTLMLYISRYLFN